MRIWQSVLSFFGLRLAKSSTYSFLVEELNKFEEAKNEIKFMIAILHSDYSSDAKVEALGLRAKSKSQMYQDLIVLLETGFKKSGYFVEFGATDGVTLSNTFLLEKNYGWTGILAEPGKTWIEDLRKNRDCGISDYCVWSSSGEQLMFNDTLSPELSTLDQFSSYDALRTARTYGRKYTVNTVSLEDLLLKFDAPLYIDVLSIDTEGSEFAILSSFNFDKYEFGLIMCEHNFSPQREQIYDLLISKGYERFFQEISQQDDWYVRRRTT